MILDPHQPPILPFCARCEQPVEQIRFSNDPNEFALTVHVKCCAGSASVRLSREDVLRISRSPHEKFYVLRGAGRAEQFLERKRG